MIELQTEEPQKNKTHTWRLYWFHETDPDASYPADDETLARVGFVPKQQLALQLAAKGKLIEQLEAVNGQLTAERATREHLEEGCALFRLLVTRNLGNDAALYDRAEAWDKVDEAPTLPAAEGAQRVECTCPYSEKNPDAGCTDLCLCRACHPERGKADQSTKCKYCNRPDCESAKFRDDPHLLRMCRHAVQLERDFLANRVGRLESALKEAEGAKAAEFRVGQRVKHPRLPEGEVLGPNQTKTPPHTWVRLDDGTAHCLDDSELDPADPAPSSEPSPEALNACGKRRVPHSAATHVCNQPADHAVDCVWDPIASPEVPGLRENPCLLTIDSARTAIDGMNPRTGKRCSCVGCWPNWPNPNPPAPGEAVTHKQLAAFRADLVAAFGLTDSPMWSDSMRNAFRHMANEIKKRGGGT